MTSPFPLTGLDAFEDALGAIKANPGSWDQWSYRCRSGMCLAGHLADRAGGVWLEDADSSWSDMLEALPGETGTDYRVHGEDHCGVDAVRRAEAILGFSQFLRTGGRALFAADNSLADLEAMYADLRAAEAAGRLHEVAFVLPAVAP